MVDHCDIGIMCGVCQRRFKRKQHLKAHANVHYKLQPPTIWCSLCNAGFVSNSQFESHQCLHHVNGGDSQPDDQTDYNHQSNTEYAIDQSTIEYANDESNNDYANEQSNTEYANDQSDMTDYNESNVAEYDDNDEHEQSDVAEYGEQSADSAAQEHKKENHLPTEFVQIPIVNCMSGAPGMVEESHIPTPVKVYVCKFCQKPFRRKDHYKIHLHIHTGVKTAFCPDCGKGFYRKDHLQKHMSIHVRHRPERPERGGGAPNKPKKALPGLYPINMLKEPKPDVIEPEVTIKPAASFKPEITITAPSTAKLRVPLQIKVPYQMVIASQSGDAHVTTVHPQT
ncbi:hypothetical protein NE865_00272 [Phthorimaea operculella]|nr:hypothetical protein NE865_00272 [Phthorimaea operculella]